ncbi:hypothetical protein [Pelagibius sp.]|uniref:hypothetical protein n=1 Tax=Pelagibius sp. TaxID=1931238 RepID=UPI0026157BB4|nr:hypothetical protein [Pelagibius sp.]
MWTVQDSEILRNYAIVFGGILGIGIAWWRGLAASRQAKSSSDQVEISRRDHISELFSKSIEQLSNQRADIRLGAVYTLKRIGEEFPEYKTPVANVFSFFIRNTSIADQDEPGGISKDVAEALDYLWQVTEPVRD